MSLLCGSAAIFCQPGLYHMRHLTRILVHHMLGQSDFLLESDFWQGRQRPRSGPCRSRSIAWINTLGTGNYLHRVGYRSEEHTSELQSLMRISYAVFCLKKKTNKR